MNVSVMPQFDDLAGKVAVVTGAAQGIGEAYVSALAAQGAHVVAIDLNFDALLGLQERLRANYEVRIFAGDVSDVTEMGVLVHAIQAECGGIDIWVNNAGVYPRAAFLDSTQDQWDFAVNVNLRGLFFVSQAVAHAMVAGGRGGAIVNMASIAAQKVLPGTSIYSVTKAGVEHLTRTTAVELATFGIRVNAIAPGQIETAMTEWVRSDPSQAEAARSRIPLGRFGQVRDLVGAMLFLASEASSYITGHTLAVDGGVRHL